MYNLDLSDPATLESIDAFFATATEDEAADLSQCLTEMEGEFDLLWGVVDQSLPGTGSQQFVVPEGDNCAPT